jgi:hypothetical protein
MCRGDTKHRRAHGTANTGKDQPGIFESPPEGPRGRVRLGLTADIIEPGMQKRAVVNTAAGCAADIEGVGKRHTIRCNAYATKRK